MQSDLLTDLLTSKGLSARLSQDVELIDVRQLGLGYMSDVFRVNIHSQNLPGSMILKTVSSDEVRAAIADRFHSYHKECFFYQNLAAETGIRVPHCYYASAEPFVLLLEDLNAAAEIPLMVGTTLQQSLTAVTRLSQLQSHSWQQYEPALPGFEKALAASTDDMSSFVSQRLSELPRTPESELLQHYANNPMAHLKLFLDQPQVLSHMDFRLDNFRFIDNDLVIFDWGDYCIAPIGFDLAYLAVTSLSIDNRRAWEARMLALHIEQLKLNGIERCSEMALLDSYRSALLPSYYLAALVLTNGPREIGEELQKRNLAAITDHLPWLEKAF